MKKKKFNQQLFNVLTVIALAALTGYAALLTWMMFSLSSSNLEVIQSLL